MNAPTPHERGWIISFNEISIRWVTCNQAPINLMKDFACKCKRTHCNTAVSIAITHEIQAQKMRCLQRMKKTKLKQYALLQYSPVVCLFVCLFVLAVFRSFSLNIFHIFALYLLSNLIGI